MNSKPVVGHAAQTNNSQSAVAHKKKPLTRCAVFIFVLLASLFTLSQSATAQVTLRVNNIPTNTPTGATLYVAGNFNGWNPSSTPLSANANGTYSIVLNPPTGILEYKFTRGSWSNPEGNESGGFLPNRTYNYTGGTVEIDGLSILSWEDLSSSGGNHTANAQVSIIDDNFYIPQLDRYRRIWLYLPPDYGSNSSKYYPVLYMHDGQNLFDAAYSYAGEWGVDEMLSLLALDQADYSCIVVGIDNGGALRLNEYSPWQNPTYGGGDGDEYISFIVNTLKPFIDEHYRTLSEREHTGIMGSSMGGLISLYAALEYPEVFGRAGIFSPSLWFSDEIFTFAQTHPHESQMKIDFMCGDQESGTMVPLMQDMYNLLLTNGFSTEELQYEVVAGGQHNETLWHNEFSETYQWLFDNTTTGNHTAPAISAPKTRVYPNPTGDLLIIDVPQNNPSCRPNRIELSNSKGQLVLDRSITGSDSLSLSILPNGVYFWRVKQDDFTLSSGKIEIIK